MDHSIYGTSIIMGNNLSEANNDIRRTICSFLLNTDTRTNILLIGDQHCGKSSLVNTVIRILYDVKDSSWLVCPVGHGIREDGHTTKYYRRASYKKMYADPGIRDVKRAFKKENYKNLCFFDTRGYTYETDRERLLLPFFMNGIRASANEANKVELNADDPNIVQLLEELRSTANKIDVVFIVINGQLLVGHKEFWNGRQVIPQAMLHYRELLTTLSSREPILIINKEDKLKEASLSREKVLNHFGSFMPITNIFFTTSYRLNEEGQTPPRDLKLENSVLNMLLTVITRLLASNVLKLPGTSDQEEDDSSMDEE